MYADVPTERRMLIGQQLPFNYHWLHVRLHPIIRLQNQQRSHVLRKQQTTFL